MRALTNFSIPIKGLKIGLQSFHFSIEDDFFSNFEESLIKKGKFEVDLDLDKKTDHLELNFAIKGHAFTNCDRCTADINLPIEISNSLLVKYNTDVESKNDEVWYITYDTNELNVASIIYEFLNLGMPLSKTFECEEISPLPCNEEVMKKLESEGEESNTSDFAEILKNIDLN